jgi:hypothetical protein
MISIGNVQILLIMQQDGLVRFVTLGNTKAQESLQEQVEAINARNIELGYDPINLATVDDIAHLASFWADWGGPEMAGREVRLLPEELDRHLDDQERDFAHVERDFIRITREEPNTERVRTSVSKLRSHRPAHAGDKQAYVLDWEWKPEQPGIDCMQIACDTYMAIYQVRRLVFSVIGPLSSAIRSPGTPSCPPSCAPSWRTSRSRAQNTSLGSTRQTSIVCATPTIGRSPLPRPSSSRPTFGAIT